MDRVASPAYMLACKPRPVLAAQNSDPRGSLFVSRHVDACTSYSIKSRAGAVSDAKSSKWRIVSSAVSGRSYGMELYVELTRH